MEELMRIGVLAQKAGVTPRTIRFYVQEKLIAKPVNARKNMAFYHPDSVFQIRAIKKAQARRFMPLVVIRQILEANNYDYQALESPEPGLIEFATPARTMAEIDEKSHLPGSVLDMFEKKKWIPGRVNTKKEKKYSHADARLLKLVEILNSHGANWADLLAALDSIDSLVKKTIELEFKSFTGWALKNPAADFNDIQTLARNCLDDFVAKARKRHLADLVCRNRKDLDYSFFASADEGFALPSQEITAQIQKLEKRLKPRSPDIRILNDLAIGYSCMGDIDTSLRYLRRVRRAAPDDLETRVRWIWYRRFSATPKGAASMKQQMKDLVEKNPDFAIGRAFLGIWHMFDLLEADDPGQVFCLANLCLEQLSLAEKNMPDNLHQRTLILYAKSRILMEMPDAADHLLNSIHSFNAILSEKARLDLYYSKHLPFFPKWLWPNIYYFSGIAHNRAKLYEQAVKMFKQGEKFNVLPPFHDHIQAGIKIARSGIQHREEKDG